MESRRTFLAGLVLTGVSSGLAASPVGSPSRFQQLPPKPTPAGEPEPEGPSLPDASKKILEENDKEIGRAHV